MSAIHFVPSDRVFRDPIHGIVEFVGENRPIGRLLETRAMQRLRRIKQMGFAWLVYTGAEHSRFGHAMGAFHIADKITRKLGLSPEISQTVKVAALLHDIGHGPFSHTWEQAFEGADHEHWGAEICSKDDELASVLQSIDSTLPASLEAFWNKSFTPSFARKLVSSQLDVDRLDYLLRDGHYSGAGYATYDLEWILHALRIESIHGGQDPSDLVIDYRRGMYAVEQYLFARTYMYAQVYHHKAVRAAEAMFLSLLARFGELAKEGNEPEGLSVAADLARGKTISVKDYLWLDDTSLMSAIHNWAGQGVGVHSSPTNDPILADLCQRFVQRRLFKTIDLGDDPSIVDRIQDDIHTVAQKHFGSSAHYYVQIDRAHQVGYKPSTDEELHVVGHPKHGTITLSKLLQELPLGKPNWTMRLLCAPELLQDLIPITEAALR